MFVFQDFKISRFQDFSKIIHISTYISRFQVFQDFKIFQILNLNYNPNLHTLEYVIALRLLGRGVGKRATVATESTEGAS